MNKQSSFSFSRGAIPAAQTGIHTTVNVESDTISAARPVVPLTPSAGMPAREKRAALYILSLLLDCLAMVAGFAVAIQTRNAEWLMAGDRPLLTIALPVFLMFEIAREVQSVESLESRSLGTRRAWGALGATALLLIGGLFLFDIDNFSRLGFVVTFAAAALWIAVGKFLLDLVVRRWLGTRATATILVLDGLDVPSGDIRNVVDVRALGLSPSLHEPGQMDALSRLIEPFDRVIVACKYESRATWAMFLRSHDVGGEIVLDRDLLHGAVSIGQFAHQDTLVLSRGPLSLPNRIQKRLFDIAVATLAILALSPVLIAVAIAIRLDSKGPIFFRQVRVGQGNRHFRIFKFRSMRAERTDNVGNRSASRDDDRVTGVGRFIRRTSLDELPQLFNVLLGDMSVVGPRPHALGSQAGDALFWEATSQYWLRHALKPGHYWSCASAWVSRRDGADRGFAGSGSGGPRIFVELVAWRRHDHYPAHLARGHAPQRLLRSCVGFTASAMRYIGILLIILSLPGFVVLLRNEKVLAKYVYFAIGTAPLTLSMTNLDASFYNLSAITYYAKGLVVTLLDTLCLAILITNKRPLQRLPFVGVFAFYIFAILLSSLQTPGFIAELSYAFQIMRVFIVFAAVASIVQRPGAIQWIAYGLAFGAIVQAGYAVKERLGGELQAAGTLGHQNLLGMMLHFVTLPLLALLLAGNKSKLIMGGIAGGILAVALGASRGSIGFLALGVGLLIVFSLIRRTTPGKLVVVGYSVLLVLAVSPIVYGGLQQRFDRLERAGGYDERAAFEKAATMMWNDNPMGVGANRYSLVANAGGYSERAGVHWNFNSRNAKVHNLYLLTGAETGFVGFVAVLAFLFVPIVRGFQFAFTKTRDPRGDVVLGATVAVLVSAIHSLYEWIFVIANLQYMLAISLGIIAGMVRQRSAETGAARRARLRAGTERQTELQPVPQPSSRRAS